ncbi:MAG: hypothetical protein AAGF82_08280, partial [Pseudomonadota bacterium]
KSSFWKNMQPADVRRKWDNFEELTATYAEENSEVCHRMRYEDYLEGAGKLEPLFDFLKEPFDAARMTELLQTRLKH